MAYKLVVSFNNNEEVMVWPSVPPDFGPEVEQRNGTYEGISGDFNTLVSVHAAGGGDGRVEVCGVHPAGTGAAHPLPGDPAGQLRPVPPEYGLLH